MSGRGCGQLHRSPHYCSILPLGERTMTMARSGAAARWLRLADGGACAAAPFAYVSNEGIGHRLGDRHGHRPRHRDVKVGGKPRGIAVVAATARGCT